jgi:hypothetical protein
MTALAIVEHLDVLEDGSLGLGPRSEAALVNHLLLQRRKEAFHRRIIHALALAAAHSILDCVSPAFLISLRYSVPAYWLPRSE